MNIIAMRRDERAHHIKGIMESVESMLIRKDEVNFKKVVLAAMAELNLSRRTAIEYVEVAFLKLQIDKDGKDK